MSVGHPSSPAAPAKTKPHRDLRTSVALLAALLAWDLAGADLA